MSNKKLGAEQGAKMSTKYSAMIESDELRGVETKDFEFSGSRSDAWVFALRLFGKGLIEIWDEDELRQSSETKVSDSLYREWFGEPK